jgi:hypothetical protein
VYNLIDMLFIPEYSFQTFRHRMHVIDTIPQLKIHRQLFLDLGVDGTSSDEEDLGNPGVFLVKQRKELSSYVNDLKRCAAFYSVTVISD